MTLLKKIDIFKLKQDNKRLYRLDSLKNGQHLLAIHMLRMTLLSLR